MKKYDSKLIFKITFATLFVGLINFFLIKKTHLSDVFIYINYVIFLMSFIATASFIVTEYLKNEYRDKAWFSKGMSFFADLMLISIVMAILYTLIPAERTIYMVTLLTLPFLSAFQAFFTNKYLPFLIKFSEARTKQEINYQEALRLSSERAIIIRKEKEERKKRIEDRQIARLKRKHQKKMKR